MYTNLNPHYGAHQPGHAPQGRRCVNSVRASLILTFGRYPGTAEMADYVVSLCHGKTTRQCRRILNTSILFQPMWAEFGWPESITSGNFVHRALVGLRKGGCFRHQGARRPARPQRHRATFTGHTSAHRVAYGQDDVVVEETGETEEEAGRQQAGPDPVILNTILTNVFELIGQGMNVANESENRRLIREQMETAGYNTSNPDNQAAIDAYAAGLAASGGDPATIAALNAELEAQANASGPADMEMMGKVLGGVLLFGAAVVGGTWAWRTVRGNSAQFYPVY